MSTRDPPRVIPGSPEPPDAGTSASSVSTGTLSAPGLPQPGRFEPRRVSHQRNRAGGLTHLLVQAAFHLLSCTYVCSSLASSLTCVVPLMWYSGVVFNGSSDQNAHFSAHDTDSRRRVGRHCQSNICSGPTIGQTMYPFNGNSSATSR